MLRYAILLLSAASAGVAAESSPEALMQQGHFKRARVLVEAMLQANPNDTRALCWLSHIRLGAGERDGALKLAEKAVGIDPKSVACRVQLAEVVGSMAEHASALRQLTLGRRFKKEIDTALALDPRNVPALEYVMQYYLQAPGILGGDKDKARAIAGQIVQLDPVRGADVQAMLAWRDKQSERIESIRQKAVALRPESYEARTRLAEFYLSRDHRNFELSEEHARAALRIDPGRALAYAILAQISVVREKYEEAEAILERAKAQVADNLMPFFRVGNQLATSGKELGRAEKYLRIYLSQEPELGTPGLAQAHWRLGVALEKQGRKDEAVGELRTAIKLEPGSPARQDLKRLL